MDGQFRALEFNSSAVTQEVSGCNHMQTPPLNQFPQCKYRSYR